jgi:O-antigen/teichoic acid export membrane protein
MAACITGAGLLNAIASALPSILLLIIYGSTVAGSFAFAYRIISVPMALLGAAASQLFMGEAARLLRESGADVGQLFNDFSRRLLWVGGAVALAGISSPIVFPIIFGNDWKDAGRFAFMLSWASAFQVIVSPMSVIAILKKRQGVQLALDAFRIIIIALALTIPYMLGAGAISTILAFAIAMIITYSLSYYIYYKLAWDCLSS